ncbi:MAG: Hsp20 family protein [Clostridium sp.]
MFSLLPLGFLNTNINTGTSLQNIMQSFFNMDFASSLNLNEMFRATIKEREEDFIICADFSGINRSDIKFAYKNNYFTIAVIRRAGAEQRGDNFRVIQGCCGQTSRSFYVENVNVNLMKAGFKGDMLVIKLPKKGKLIEAKERVLIE